MITEKLSYAEVPTGEAEDTPDRSPENGQAGRTEPRARPCGETTGFRPFQYSTSNLVELDQRRRFLRRRQCLTALRRHTVTGRVRAIQERKMCLQQREHVLRTGQRWMEAAEGVTAKLDRSECQAPLQSLYEQMRESFVLLDTYTERVKRFEGDLSQLEFRLSRKEAKFYKDYVELLSDDDSCSIENDEYCIVSSSDASSEEIHPLLRKYYDKAGDVNVLKDRLNELEFDHQQEMFMRDERMGLGEPISPSEQAFQELYFTERSNTIRNLSEAQAEARRLREQCLRNGMMPEDSIETDGLEAFQDPSWAMVNPLSDTGGDRTFGRIKPLELTRYGITSTCDRILQWLDVLVLPSAQRIAQEDQDLSIDSGDPVSDAGSSQTPHRCHADTEVDGSSNTSVDAINAVLGPSKRGSSLTSGLRRRHSDSERTVGPSVRPAGPPRPRVRSSLSVRTAASR